MMEIQLNNAKCTSVCLSAQVKPHDSGKETTGGFIIEAYTGSIVDRWWGKLVISVEGIKAKKLMPIFRDHSPGQIVGFADKNWKDGSFFVSGKFSKATKSGLEVKALVDEGFPWQASIGVRPYKIMAIEKDGEMEVNGKTIKGPAEVWLESEVMETSFVPVGADDNTSVSTFSKITEKEAHPPHANIQAKEKKENFKAEIYERSCPHPIKVPNLKETFEGNKALVDEFGSFEVYKAYKTAVDSGLVRICGK